MPEGDVVLQTVDRLRNLFGDDLQEYHLIKFQRFHKPANKTPVVRFPLVDVDDMKPAIDGKFLDLYCKGKYYFFEFENDISIVAHHGLKGHWTSEPATNTQFGFTFCKFDANGDLIGEEISFYFTNILSGEFKILKTRAELNERLNSIAPGFIGRWILTLPDWLQRLNRFGPKKRLRDILFDQNAVCSGLGNYQLAEIFYVMEFDPRIKLGDLSGDQRVELYHVCRFMMEGHYRGKLQKVIYKKSVCPAGHPVQRLTVGGRVAHWVPNLQRIGRPA